MLDHHRMSAGGFAEGAGETHARWQAAVRELPATQLYHLQWHLLRLEDGCRRSRFGSFMSDDFLRDYSARADAADTIVLGCFVDGHMRGTVELRWQPSNGCHLAEIAFSVEKRWQGQGIGTALMAAAIGAARDRGIVRLLLTCHTLNRRMQRIAERFGATIGFEGCECFAELAVGEQEPEKATDLQV
jgi:RimJ/RimL family protein N-acetyltransferase